MNLSHFTDLLQNPGSLNKEDSKELEQLLEEFPYFQTAHLLYLKSLHNQNSIHYNNRLKLTAAYAGDRKVLYEFISSEKKEVPAKVIEKKPDPVSEAITLQELEIKSEPLENISVAPEPIIDIPILTKDTGINIDLLEKEILSEAINSSIELEVSELEPFGEDDTVIEEESPTEISKPIITQPEPVKKEEIPEEFNPDEKHSFSEWLSFKKQAGEISEEKQKEKDEISSLIDKFIQEAPKMPKPKAEFYSPVNMARQSVTDNESFVTETLARIYEKQGNFPKAIKAYETLSLKFPEKNAYFAALIKEIKKQNNL